MLFQWGSSYVMQDASARWKDSVPVHIPGTKGVYLLCFNAFVFFTFCMCSSGHLSQPPPNVGCSTVGLHGQRPPPPLPRLLWPAKCAKPSFASAFLSVQTNWALFCMQFSTPDLGSLPCLCGSKRLLQQWYTFTPWMYCVTPSYHLFWLAYPLCFNFTVLFHIVCLFLIPIIFLFYSVFIHVLSYFNFLLCSDLESCERRLQGKRTIWITIIISIYPFIIPAA